LAQGEKERFFRGQQGEVGGAALAIRKYIVGCAAGTAAQALRIPREGLTSFLTGGSKEIPSILLPLGDQQSGWHERLWRVPRRNFQ